MPRWYKGYRELRNFVMKQLREVQTKCRQLMQDSKLNGPDSFWTFVLSFEHSFEMYGHPKSNQNVQSKSYSKDGLESFF